MTIDSLQPSPVRLLAPWRPVATDSDSKLAAEDRHDATQGYVAGAMELVSACQFHTAILVRLQWLHRNPSLMRLSLGVSIAGRATGA